MRRISTSASLLLLATLLAGCATSKDVVLPHGDATMLDIWNRQTGGSALAAQATQQLLEARQALRRPLIPADLDMMGTTNAVYTRTAEVEIHRQFHRLPNPDLVMYVFPHLTGTVPAPVPGYSTVFSFYQRVQYAMPGEPTQDD